MECVTDMIESKEQLLNGFIQAAEAFLADQNLVNGINLDDATVSLKRYVLSELHDQAAASELAKIPPLIRGLDTAALAELVGELKQRLAG